MLPANPSSILYSSNPSIFSLPKFSISTVRCRAADLPAGPSFPRWLHLFTTADASAGVRSKQGLDGVGVGGGVGSTADGSARRSSGNAGSGVKVNAWEKRWSRNRESYLADDDDALPLPMTYPDSSPVAPEEIDRRLRCDPQVEVLLFSSSSSSSFIVVGFRGCSLNLEVFLYYLWKWSMLPLFQIFWKIKGIFYLYEKPNRLGGLIPKV